MFERVSTRFLQTCSDLHSSTALIDAIRFVTSSVNQILGTYAICIIFLDNCCKRKTLFASLSISGIFCFLFSCYVWWMLKNMGFKKCFFDYRLSLKQNQLTQISVRLRIIINALHNKFYPPTHQLPKVMIIFHSQFNPYKICFHWSVLFSVRTTKFAYSHWNDIDM